MLFAALPLDVHGIGMIERRLLALWLAATLGFLSGCSPSGEQIRAEELRKALDKDRPGILQVEQGLKKEGDTIDSLEKDLKAAEAQVDSIEARISDLRGRIEATERRYPGGIPSSLYNSYVQQVEQHNALVSQQNRLVTPYNVKVGRFNGLIDDYEAKYTEYSRQVDAYNQRVQELNSIVSKGGGGKLVAPGLIRLGRIGIGKLRIR